MTTAEVAHSTPRALCNLGRAALDFFGTPSSRCRDELIITAAGSPPGVLGADLEAVHCDERLRFAAAAPRGGHFPYLCATGAYQQIKPSQGAMACRTPSTRAWRRAWW